MKKIAILCFAAMLFSSFGVSYGAQNNQANDATNNIASDRAVLSGIAGALLAMGSGACFYARHCLLKKLEANDLSEEERKTLEKNRNRYKYFGLGLGGCAGLSLLFALGNGLAAAGVGGTTLLSLLCLGAGGSSGGRGGGAVEIPRTQVRSRTQVRPRTATGSTVYGMLPQADFVQTAPRNILGEDGQNYDVVNYINRWVLPRNERTGEPRYRSVPKLSEDDAIFDHLRALPEVGVHDFPVRVITGYGETLHDRHGRVAQQPLTYADKRLYAKKITTHSIAVLLPALQQGDQASNRFWRDATGGRLRPTGPCGYHAVVNSRLLGTIDSLSDIVAALTAVEARVAMRETYQAVLAEETRRPTGPNGQMRLDWLSEGQVDHLFKMDNRNKSGNRFEEFASSGVCRAYATVNVPHRRFLIRPDGGTRSVYSADESPSRALGESDDRWKRRYIRWLHGKFGYQTLTRAELETEDAFRPRCRRWLRLPLDEPLAQVRSSQHLGFIGNFKHRFLFTHGSRYVFVFHNAGFHYWAGMVEYSHQLDKLVFFFADSLSHNQGTYLNQAKVRVIVEEIERKLGMRQ